MKTLKQLNDSHSRYSKQYFKLDREIDKMLYTPEYHNLIVAKQDVIYSKMSKISSEIENFGTKN